MKYHLPTLQTYGFSPVWTLMCVTSLYLALNGLNLLLQPCSKCCYISNNGAIGKKLVMDTVVRYLPQAGELLAALPVLLVTRLHVLHQRLSVTHLPEHKQHQF